MAKAHLYQIGQRVLYYPVQNWGRPVNEGVEAVVVGLSTKSSNGFQRYRIRLVGETRVRSVVSYNMHAVESAADAPPTEQAEPHAAAQEEMSE